MKHRIKAWLPAHDSLRNHRWLRWMGPVLSHPRLWHFSRKGIALGVAVGLFFGLLIPIAQIPASAAFAVLLRANLPVAVASTFVSNPLTFGPLYYGAYRLGQVVLGEPTVAKKEVAAALATAAEGTATVNAEMSLSDRLLRAGEHLKLVGKPLAVGLAIVASVSGLLVYFLISGVWALRTRWTRRQRLLDRSRDPRAVLGTEGRTTEEAHREPIPDEREKDGGAGGN
jgi:uncharacterized protein